MPDTSIGNDVLELAQRNDLGGMSFGFTVPKDGERWSGTKRELRAVNLLEVSRRSELGRHILKQVSLLEHDRHCGWRWRCDFWRQSNGIASQNCRHVRPGRNQDDLAVVAVIELAWRAVDDGGRVVNARTSENLSTVLACVSAISSAIASLPAFVYRVTDAGREEDNTHPLARLIRNGPNSKQTWPDFLEWLVASTLLRGNGLVEIVTDGGGRVIEPDANSVGIRSRATLAEWAIGLRHRRHDWFLRLYWKIAPVA